RRRRDLVPCLKMSANGKRKLSRAGELSAPSKFRVGSYLFRECCRLQGLVGYFEPQCLIVDALFDSIVHDIAPFRLSPLWAKSRRQPSYSIAGAPAFQCSLAGMASGCR